MTTESATYIADLNPDKPYGRTEDRNLADDYLRLIKSVMQNSFPGQNFARGFYADTSTTSGSYKIDGVVAGQLVDGFELTFRAKTANTSAGPTINIAGSDYTIKQGTVDVIVGGIQANQFITIRYDATNSTFQLLNPYTLDVATSIATAITAATATIVDGWVGRGFAVWPAGVVLTWPINSVPDYTLLCDGQSIAQADYGKLFAVLGRRYTKGTVPPGNFSVPNYKGYFLRGFSGNSADDPGVSERTDRGDGVTGSSLGTKQADEIKGHTHGVTVARYNHTQGIYGGGGRPYANYERWAGVTNTDYTTTATGGAETRPKNITVNYIITTGGESATT